MAVDLALPRARARGNTFDRVAGLPARVVLGGIVCVSFAVRLVCAFAHAVPVYFPDEYIYSSLARGFAESGRPEVRGGVAHFPALLEPLLAAPTWLFGDPMLAYRLTQAEHALAMSLAAVPVYLLARRLELGPRVGLGVALLAVTTPDAFFASFILADPIAYPLVLGAVCAGVAAIAEPTRRSQLAFAGLAGLAVFARVQYVVVPVAFVLAAIVVERGRVLQVARKLRLSLALLVSPLLVVSALGPARLLGYYSDVLDQRLTPSALAHWAGVDAMLLAYSAGWILVPGALLGLWFALARPRSRAERAFAALTVALAGGLLLEAAIYASNGSARFQERYLFSLLPLVGLAFALHARRGWPARLPLGAIAAFMLALSAAIPLSGYTIRDGKQDSPLLHAVFRLEQVLGVGNGAMAVAAVAALLAAAAFALPLAGRRGVGLGLGAAAMATAAISVGAFDLGSRNASGVRAVQLPERRDWVDRARLGDVALLAMPGTTPDRALQQLFWNRSVTSVLLFPGAGPIDRFGSEGLDLDRKGFLLRQGRRVRTPLLVETFSASVTLAGATAVGRSGTYELWRPDGDVRLSVLGLGRYSDGWLASKGEIGVFPDASARVRGVLRLELGLPPDARPTVMRLRPAGGAERRVEILPGTRRTVTFEVDFPRVWSLRFQGSEEASLWDGRPVSVQASKPVFERAGAPPSVGTPSGEPAGASTA
ncbi:MAG: ArnT family glycosyltransferase [Gaiellaceae bacterium]